MSAMADYLATVEWRSGGGFLEGRYSRAHRLSFDGGAVVPGSASPHVVPAPYSDPAGVDPEEALVASVSACHMLWFLHLARDAGLDVSAYRDEARGRMAKDGRGRMAMTRIVLRPEIEFAGNRPGADLLERLHHEAHERCFIANSLRTEIVVES
jgi:organic hydroperoxide reductase OsmC/OhrA